MQVHELGKDIIYVENVFSNAKNFIDRVEELDDNPLVQSVIPSWQYWADGGPVPDPEKENAWVQIIIDTLEQVRGVEKNFDWDQSINSKNCTWPRKIVNKDFSPAHQLAFDLISFIENDYIESLKIWAKLTGHVMPLYITRNYCLRKYRTGGSMGPHVDKFTENPLNTMDWTALVYLNDDYEGGEILFDDINLEVKPSAGSVIFFPCLEKHSVKEITKGNKYYLFFFMHTDSGIATALGEPYFTLSKDVLNMVTFNELYALHRKTLSKV